MAHTELTPLSELRQQILAGPLLGENLRQLPATCTQQRRQVEQVGEHAQSEDWQTILLRQQRELLGEIENAQFQVNAHPWHDDVPCAEPSIVHELADKPGHSVRIQGYGRFESVGR